MAVAAGVAASVTYGFGHACKAYYKSGMTLELPDVAEIFSNMQKQHTKIKMVANRKVASTKPPTA